MGLTEILGRNTPTVINQWETVIRDLGIVPDLDEIEDEVLEKIPNLKKYAERYQKEIEAQADKLKQAEESIGKIHLILSKLFDDLNRFKMWRHGDYTSFRDWVKDMYDTGRLSFKEAQAYKLLNAGKFFRIFQHELVLMQDIVLGIGNIDNITEIISIISHLADRGVSPEERQQLLREWLTVAKDRSFEELRSIVSNAKEVMRTEIETTGEVRVPSVRSVMPQIIQLSHGRRIEGWKASRLPTELRGKLLPSERIEIEVREYEEETHVIVKKATFKINTQASTSA